MKMTLVMVSSAVTLIAVTLAPSASRADSFAEKCPEVVSCAKAVGLLLGQKYVFDADVKGKWEATPALELTRENADVLFSNMLYGLGYSRVPLGTAGTFQIMRIRDAKDSAIPTFYGKTNDDPKLPDTWDYATLVYTTVDSGNVQEIARVLRNFMPPSSRIIALDMGGKLFVTDAAVNLRKMYTLIRELDVKPTAEMKKKWAEEEARRERDRDRGREHERNHERSGDHDPGHNAPGRPEAPPEHKHP